MSPLIVPAVLQFETHIKISRLHTDEEFIIIKKDLIHRGVMVSFQLTTEVNQVNAVVN